MVLALPLKGFMGRGSRRVHGRPRPLGSMTFIVSVMACCIVGFAVSPLTQTLLHISQVTKDILFFMH